MIMEEKKILNYEQTKEKALRLLEFRAHSEKELKDKLIRAGATEENIEKALDFCREYKFVNDELYAKRKAKDLQNLKKFGKYRIKSELSQKGIASDLIELALLELDEEEGDRLEPLIRKKLSGNFEKKNIDKCIRYFIYRGYGFGDIKSCIENIKTEEANEL